MKKKSNCVLCSFENPKPTATAVIIKQGRLLVAKRAEEPFLGKWDFIGGYVQKNEPVEEALRREIQEELGVDSRSTYLGQFPGRASYRGYEYPVLSFAFLTELVNRRGEPAAEEDIKLNVENSGLAWLPIKKLKRVAFDSNMKILRFIKERLDFDLTEVRSLVAELDSTAIVNEHSLYQAALQGFVSRIYNAGRLIGLGWVFPRQTMLRRQAVVEDMIVKESERGKGLGEKILRDLLRWAKRSGVEVVELTTNPKRLAANALYQKAGFKLHVTNHYLLRLNEYDD